MQFKVISVRDHLLLPRMAIRDFYLTHVQNSSKPNVSIIRDNRTLNEVYDSIKIPTDINVTVLKDVGDFHVYRLDYNSGETVILKIVNKDFLVQENVNTHIHRVQQNLSVLKTKINDEKLKYINLAKNDPLNLFVRVIGEGDGYFYMQQAEGDLYSINLSYKVELPIIQLKESGRSFEIVEQVGNEYSNSKLHADALLYKLFLKALFLVFELHEMGYVHADLKLDNMVYFNNIDDCDISLIDFGEAIYFDTVGISANAAADDVYGHLYNKLKEHSGTNEFLSPEFSLGINRERSWRTISHISEAFERPSDDSDSDVSLDFTGYAHSRITDERPLCSSTNDINVSFQKRDFYALYSAVICPDHKIENDFPHVNQI